jgi:hypothetical protein
MSVGEMAVGEMAFRRNDTDFKAKWLLGEMVLGEMGINR